MNWIRHYRPLFPLLIQNLGVLERVLSLLFVLKIWYLTNAFALKEMTNLQQNIMLS